MEIFAISWKMPKNHPTLARHCDQTIQLELNYWVSFERYWTYLYVHVHLACPWLRTQKFDFTATFYYSSLNKTPEFSPPKILCSKRVHGRQVSLITSRKVPKNSMIYSQSNFQSLRRRSYDFQNTYRRSWHFHAAETQIHARTSFIYGVLEDKLMILGQKSLLTICSLSINL